MSNKEYFDGPRVVSAEQSKRDRAQAPRNLERENEELVRKVETMRTICDDFGRMSHRCQTLEGDLKQSNTNLQHYKERTKMLQKQVDGLKSGKLKPDNVPNFKSANPNQQIIKALLNENENLTKNIEQMKKIKEKVMHNTANVDRSDILEALVQLEEENKGLRSRLNMGDASPHSYTGSEEESVEITQLRERLKMSVNHSRDLKDNVETLERELTHNRKLLEERFQQLNLRTISPAGPAMGIKNSNQALARGDPFVPFHPDPGYFVPSHHPPMYPDPFTYGQSPTIPPHSVVLPTTGAREKHKPRTSPHPPHSYQPPDMYPK